MCDSYMQYLSFLTMLPPELVQIITHQLDLPSLCALAQTNKSWSVDICDHVFEEHLQQVCP